MNSSQLFEIRYIIVDIYIQPQLMITFLLVEPMRLIQNYFLQAIYVIFVRHFIHLMLFSCLICHSVNCDGTRWWCPQRPELCIKSPWSLDCSFLLRLTVQGRSNCQINKQTCVREQIMARK